MGKALGKPGAFFFLKKIYQRIAFFECSFKISLHRENGLEPENPRYAESGLG